MAGINASSAGRLLNRMLIIGLIALSAYLYWRVQVLQQENYRLSGKLADSQTGAAYPWSSIKFTVPSVLTNVGGQELALVNDSRAHLALAEKAASQNNYGVAHQETQIAEKDLQLAEQGASAGSRTAVGTMQQKVSDLERRFQAAAKAFASS